MLARHDVPLFVVLLNNGALYNSTNHRMRLAEHRGSGRELRVRASGNGTG